MSDSEVGNRIEQLRSERGWSQGQLAMRAGVSRTLLSKIESGERRLTAEVAEKLAPVLGVSPGYLRGIEDAGPDLDPDIAAVNANLLTMRKLDPSEVARVRVVVQAMVDDLLRRVREEEDADRRKRDAGSP